MSTIKLSKMSVAKRAWQGLLLLIALLLIIPSTLAAPKKLPPLAYPFTDQGEYWVNSEPLNDRYLKGKTVLVFFWTYGCYNCRNSLKWINSVQERFAPDGLLVLGIHTPEFSHERNKDNVAVKTKEYGIEFPVMIDNEYIFWKDMHNQWWPAFHLYDEYGELRGTYVGETHLGTDKAEKIETLIGKLLAS